MTRLTGTDALGLMEAYNAVYTQEELTEEQIQEDFKDWVYSLVEEGYDLSEYSWDDMYDYYINFLDEQIISEAPLAATVFQGLTRFARGARGAVTRGAAGRGTARAFPGAPAPVRPHTAPRRPGIPGPAPGPGRPAVPTTPKAPPKPGTLPSRTPPGRHPTRPTEVPPAPAPAPARPAPAPAPAPARPAPAPAPAPARPAPAPPTITPTPGRPVSPPSIPQTEPQREPVVPNRGTRIGAATPPRTPSTPSQSPRSGGSRMIPPMIIPPLIPPIASGGPMAPPPMVPPMVPPPSKPRKMEGLVGSATRPGGLNPSDPEVQRYARVMNQRGGISLSSGGSGFLAFRTDPKTGKKQTVIVQRKAVGSDDSWIGQTARALGLTKKQDQEALRKQQRQSNINRQAYLGGGRDQTTGFKQDLTDTNIRGYMAKGSKLGGLPTGGAIKKEEVDLYDVVLGYLLDEGYTNTIEDAIVIMANMSEEWKNSIINS